MALPSQSKRSAYFNYFKRDLIRSTLHRKEKYIPRAKSRETFRDFDALNKILYVSSHETILPTLLRNYDRYSMASGIEIRMPFMDYRIVTMAFSLGWKSKLHGGYSKSIIRDAMAPYMPHDIAYRKTKIGFNTPIVEWMQGPLKEYFEDIIASSTFKNCDLIQPDRVKKQIENVIHDEKATFGKGEEAWSALYPYLWEQAVLKHS